MKLDPQRSSIDDPLATALRTQAGRYRPRPSAGFGGRLRLALAEPSRDTGVPLMSPYWISRSKWPLAIAAAVALAFGIWFLLPPQPTANSGLQANGNSPRLETDMPEVSVASVGEIVARPLHEEMDAIATDARQMFGEILWVTSANASANSETQPSPG